MENVQENIHIEKPIMVGAYGYDIRFPCGFSFDPDVAPEVLIKKPSGTVIVKEATLADADEGLVVYTVQEGDINESGTHTMQVRQVGADFAFYSPISTVAVFPSIVVPSSSSSS
jgi:hypothetical protein